MFTGIIEATSKLVKAEQVGTNRSFYFESHMATEFKIDQSISHNGVCLTVEEITGTLYKVTAIQETLSKTNLGLLKAGQVVNIERCMAANARFDGHIVQGHVDETIELIGIQEMGGSGLFTLRSNTQNNTLVVDKGSITLNGVSLTVVACSGYDLSVAIIPYTLHHTTFKHLVVGDRINVEYDIIGKYINKILSYRN